MDSTNEIMCPNDNIALIDGVCPTCGKTTEELMGATSEAGMEAPAQAEAEAPTEESATA